MAFSYIYQSNPFSLPVLLNQTILTTVSRVPMQSSLYLHSHFVQRCLCHPLSTPVTLASSYIFSQVSSAGVFHTVMVVLVLQKGSANSSTSVAKAFEVLCCSRHISALGNQVTQTSQQEPIKRLLLTMYVLAG